MTHSNNAEQDPDIMIAEDMGRFYADPLGFVMYTFPWDTDRTIQMVDLPKKYRKRFPNCKYGPDAWACDLLDDLGKEIEERDFNGRDAVKPIQEAIASGHGIGKSTITAWLVLFIASTRPYSKGIVTSNTSDQLKTKTWAELGKWKRICITGHWFEYNNSKGNMNLYHTDHKESWRCDGQTCREENSESFAGLHAANSTAYYIFDEASAIPDKIWEVSEGGMTDGEPMRFAFGNPTRNTGRFRECFRKFRHRWKTRQIDSRDVSITNKSHIKEWEDDYGEDSDFFKVRVRGVFPSTSFKQFISEADVDNAYGKHLNINQYGFAPVAIGVDPSWSGDDEFVVWLRQGLMSKKLGVYEKNDNDVHMANIISGFEDEYSADAVFVDGGFGTGIVSAAQAMGRNWHLIWFGSKSPEPGCLNMRAYMWNEMKKWLKAGGTIPDDDVLRTDLTGPETVPNINGKIQLEKKEDMKKRGQPSPNRADALALTFAFPIAKQTQDVVPLTPSRVQHREYDPFAERQ